MAYKLLQYYYSADDIWRARFIQWVIVMMAFIPISGLYLHIAYTIILLALFWGQEKAKKEYRNTMAKMQDEIGATEKYKKISITRDFHTTLLQTFIILIPLLEAI